METFVAILCDVRGSRRRPNRADLRDHLQDALSRINENAQHGLVAPFELQRGIDEFGAVLRPNANVGQILLVAWEALFPVDVRFSVVRDDLDITPDGGPDRVPLYDGPALHRADDLLRSIERQGLLVGLDLGLPQPAGQLLSTNANLLYLHLLGFTQRQMEVFQAYREKGSQQEVAEAFGITQPTVSELMSKVEARLVLHSMKRFVESAGPMMEER